MSKLRVDADYHEPFCCKATMGKQGMAMIDCLKRMGAGSSPSCMICRRENPDIDNALGPWFNCNISNYGNNIAFVGKIARGDGLGSIVSENLEDVSAFGSNFIRTSSWAYWSYTREIMVRLYGSLDLALQHCSFTNLIKCNNSTTPDTSTESQHNHCIRKNNFIMHELNAVQPKAVVFYTGRSYDHLFREFMPDGTASYADEKNAKIAIGKKYMPWWSRKFIANDGSTIAKYLRIGHPERMKKEPYVSSVADWLKEALAEN